MICRNEERDIARAIKSVLPITSRFVVVDTGSTDETERVVRETVLASKLHFETFTGASERNAAGDWQLWNFAAARNHAILKAEEMGCSHLMWMDADDELLDPRPVERAMYREDVDGFNILIRAGGMTWPHFRLWHTEKHVRFKGRVHEYPVIHHLRADMLKASIAHHADPAANQEDSNARNIRILMREWEENPDSRTAFYIADTHRYGGRHEQAVEWFRRRIGFGECYRDEWLFSHLYLSRCLRALKRFDEAMNVMAGARAQEPGWAEFLLEAANIAYDRQDYPMAIELARPAMGMPITFTGLWREPYAYRDQGPRLISWCHEHMGQLAEAITWADIAAGQIGQVDEDWGRRSERLKAQFLASNDPPPAIITRKRRKVALVRPGAIGDILMTLNLIPAFKAANPDTDVHYFCAGGFAKPDALLPTMLAAGCDQVLDVAGIKAWAKSYDQVIGLIGYQIDWAKNCRRPMDRHLIRYFAEEMGLDQAASVDPWQGLKLASLKLPRPSARLGGEYVTLQVTAGWSKYKMWPLERWQEVQGAFPELRFVPIDESQGRTLAETIAIVANARLHVGVDSFANHLTHYRWGGKRVPGVIVFGSSQVTACGYPTNINLSAGLACQPCFKEDPAISTMSLGPCINPVRGTYEDDTPHACMEAISVEQVVEAIREALKWLA